MAVSMQPDLGAAAHLLPGPLRDWIRGHTDDDVPSAAATIPAIAKWWFDEVTIQMEMASSRTRIPGDGFRSRVRDELAEARQLYAERGWLADPHSFHRQPTPIREWSTAKRSTGVTRYEHVRFDSNFEPWPGEPGGQRWLDFRPVHTGHAWMLRHHDRPRPWLVAVNGYRTGSPLVDIPLFRAEQLHRKLGLNVILPVTPLHGPRAVGSASRVLHTGALNTIHTLAHGAWDIRRLVRHLRTEFGAPSVGLSGISLGGYLVSLVAALEPDLAGVIGGVPESDIARAMRRQFDPLLPPYYEQWGLSWEPLEQVMSVVSPLSMPCQVPHDRRYIYAGLLDRWVRPGNVKTLWEHWDEPKICWYNGSHLSFPMEPAVTRFVDDALTEMFHDG